MREQIGSEVWKIFLWSRAAIQKSAGDNLMLISWGQKLSFTACMNQNHDWAALAVLQVITMLFSCPFCPVIVD